MVFLITKNILLYGANGYSAKLILSELINVGIKPIIAGRNELEIPKIARDFNLEYKLFNLSNHLDVLKSLEGIDVVLNCAGPFIKTIKPFLLACLEKKVHYFDINGEIGLFEFAQSFDTQAQEQGIIICPGVGFDVVPTDCLALMLKEQITSKPINLELAFHFQGGPSKGTALTSVGGSGSGTKIRRDGKIITKPYGLLQKDVIFPHKTLRVNSIPWGDVFTAYLTTEIPNITVYMVQHPKSIKKMQRGQKFFFLRNIQPFKWYIKRKITKSIKGGGPSEEVRKKTVSYIWGKVSDDQNNHLELYLKTPNGYDLTAMTSATIISKINSIENKKGYFTPSQLFGSQFILEIPGVELIKN